jgi:hypothetical protein
VTLATIESLLGSLWFAGAALLVGYIAGHVVPVSRLGGLFGRK